MIASAAIPTASALRRREHGQLTCCPRGVSSDRGGSLELPARVHLPGWQRPLPRNGTMRALPRSRKKSDHLASAGTARRARGGGGRDAGDGRLGLRRRLSHPAPHPYLLRLLLLDRGRYIGEGPAFGGLSATRISTYYDANAEIIERRGHVVVLPRREDRTCAR